MMKWLTASTNAFLQILLQTKSPEPFSSTKTTFDVAVVGAGLSGLSAARHLDAAGMSVVVLEGRDRVGGRVENFHLINGGVTELGAAFVGPTQDHVLALAHELGLETFLQYNIGENLVFKDDQRAVYPATSPLPPTSQDALSELGEVLIKLDSMAAELDVHAPWTHPQAAYWDSLTLSTWVANITRTAESRYIFETAITAVFSVETSEMSLLYSLAYIAAAGNETERGTLERLLSVAGGAQESRIVGGTGLLAPGIVATLRPSSKVILDTAVRTITKGADGYTVFSDGHTVTAQHVVIAMSPPLAARITYNPPLPAIRDQLCQRFFMGGLGKAIAVYDHPFWRSYNLTGQVISDSGTTRATFDVSPPDASSGVLLGFIEADVMRGLDDTTDAHLRDLVTKDFVRYFGAEAAHATQWVFKRWDNELFSRGGPVAVGGPGALTKFGRALTEPVGNLHFAGTESSPYWTGYLDGAIRSGERAAKEVLGSCRKEIKEVRRAQGMRRQKPRLGGY